MREKKEKMISDKTNIGVCTYVHMFSNFYALYFAVDFLLLYPGCCMYTDTTIT